MKILIILKKTTETFVIGSLSTLFGYMGSHYFKNDYVLPSLISGIGGVFGLLLLSIPNLVLKDNEDNKKQYGRWTEGIRKQCLLYKRKAINTLLLSCLIIIIASSVLFYTIPYLIADFQGEKNKYPALLALAFFASIFTIWHTISIRQYDYKRYIREYRKFKRACMGNAEGL